MFSFKLKRTSILRIHITAEDAIGWMESQYAQLPPLLIYGCLYADLVTSSKKTTECMQNCMEQAQKHKEEGYCSFKDDLI